MSLHSSISEHFKIFKFEEAVVEFIGKFTNNKEMSLIAGRERLVELIKKRRNF